MKILIVSGFLGAGKTTFIRTLIERTRRQIAVLENELGETDLDGRTIADTASSGDVNVMDLMDGCVCCSKREGFANSIIAISSSLNPEFLVVEPTGVAMLGNVLANVHKVAWEQVRLLSPVCVLSPRSFHANLHDYPDICRDQIAHAGTIVFSKLAQCDAALAAQVEQEILRINPDVRIEASPYEEKDDAWFAGILDGDAVISSDCTGLATEETIDQYTLRDVTMPTPSCLILMLQRLLAGAFGTIVRAKGTLQCEGFWFRYDCADGLYAVTGVEEENPVSQCVFIGSDIDRQAIDACFLRTERPLLSRFHKTLAADKNLSLQPGRKSRKEPGRQ